MGGRVGPSAAAAGGGGGGGGGGEGGGGGGAGCGGSELGGAASACASPLLGRRCVRGAFSDPRARGRAGQRAGPGVGGAALSSGRRRRRGPELASLGGADRRRGEREGAAASGEREKRSKTEISGAQYSIDLASCRGCWGQLPRSTVNQIQKKISLPFVQDCI